MLFSEPLGNQSASLQAPAKADTKRVSVPILNDAVRVSIAGVNLISGAMARSFFYSRFCGSDLIGPKAGELWRTSCHWRHRQ